MQLQGKAVRVTVYIGESDRYRGKALYMALLELLRREGASGATVTRGVAGFGAHSRIHTATILTLSEDLPLRVEWVDQPEIVERLMPQVRGMVDDGLITVEKIDVVQYAPGRRPDPLAQPVRDVMRTEVTTVGPETAVGEIMTLLLRRSYRSVPVVDEADHILGIITDGDLLQRADITARLDLQEELTEQQLKQQINALRQREQTAADIMTRPVITVGDNDPVRQAVDRMVKQGLKRLPVIDGEGRLTGWISRVDVLRTLEYHHLLAEPVSQPQRGSTIAALMYRDVPAVAPDATLEEILQILEAGSYRRAVVVDDEKQVVGIITDGDLLRRSQRREPSPGLVTRLRNLITEKSAPAPLLDRRETAVDLMTAPVVTISLNTPLTEALHLMLRHRIKRLPVVDDEGRLIGLLGRGNLLRGLLRQNGD